MYTVAIILTNKEFVCMSVGNNVVEFKKKSYKNLFSYRTFRSNITKSTAYSSQSVLLALQILHEHLWLCFLLSCDSCI